MSTYTIEVPCPRCGNEIPVEVSVTGSHVPARGPSYSDGGSPADYPEADFAVPEGHIGCGPFAHEELVGLEKAIEDEALDAHQKAQYDPAWDGPCEDDR